MFKNIYLERLTLIGFRKNYTVEFKEGLNFISGPTATGKSSIVEMINYALGSENHKAYIEIKKSCSDVELEFFIGENKFKIVRPLFDFNRPVKLYRWNITEGNYERRFDLLEIDSPSNERSLSAFLLKEMGLPNIKVVNQNFSFRDIYKYCYVNQSSIDSENLLMEKHWGASIKRKPTFEIIFGIYNELLGDLKQQKKIKQEEIGVLEKKREGVSEFLANLKILDIQNYFDEKVKLNGLIQDKKQKLIQLKCQGKYDNKETMNLETIILQLKDEINNIDAESLEKEKYIRKLLLLRNQYVSEIQKIEYIIEGATILNKFSFELCPSCLNLLEPKNGCNLCGSEMESLTEEEIKVFKSELRRVKIKSSELMNFIENQYILIDKLKKSRSGLYFILQSEQNKLDHIRNQYISPYLEQIEQINFEIGNLTNDVNQLDNNLAFMNEFSKLNEAISDEKKLLSKIEKRISDIEENQLTKMDIISSLSDIFSRILEQFSFPKLENAYISEGDYLPYVRGVKYNELGSGGAVTMITIAYFLSIALLKIKNKIHPGILIIDSPRKNLGADAKNDDEFKDEAIFNSIIKTFISIYTQQDCEIEKIQLIIINNGDPEFLDENDLIVEFDGKGTRGLPYGLIDDIENL